MKNPVTTFIHRIRSYLKRYEREDYSDYFSFITLNDVLGVHIFLFTLLITELILKENSYGKIHSLIHNESYLTELIGIMLYGILFGIAILAFCMKMYKSKVPDANELGFLTYENADLAYKTDDKNLYKLCRFVHFGKLSAGIFHDILNPLAAVSLAVEKLETTRQCKHSQQEARAAIKNAFSALHRMEHYVAAAKKQIKMHESDEKFDAVREIKDVISILQYQARKENVVLSLETAKKILLYGNPIKFNQVITNLLSNAIDAYPKEFPRESNPLRSVHITCLVSKNTASFLVTDKGAGINPEHLEKLWEPFFTTKKEGFGLGLSTTKEIIETYFHGRIRVECTKKYGTRFTVSVPLLLKEKANIVIR